MDIDLVRKVNDLAKRVGELESNESGAGNYGLAVELAIASGVVTITRAYHTIDTEGDAASDDLDTINGGSAGDVIILQAANASRTVVCKDGTGNLRLAGDFSITHTDDTIMLLSNGSVWVEISRSDNAT